MDCYGYCRVSTDEQAKGVSLDAQRSKIMAYASLHDHVLLDVRMDEGVSGKSMANRPNLLTTLDMVYRTQGILVVYSISRLGRNTRDLIDMADSIAKCGAQFASISEHVDTTTASGKMFFKLMAVLAEFERDSIVERTTAALDRKRDRGEVVGNVPYGFRRNGEVLVPDATEMSGLSIILSEMDTGMSYAGIARKLDEAGHKTRNGSSWDRGVIRRIVKFHRSMNGIKLRSLNKIGV